MIPLKDDAPRLTTPYVTWTLIALNTLVYIYEAWSQTQYHGQAYLSQLISTFGVVPARIGVVLFNSGYVPWNLVTALHARYIPPAGAILPLFTSMFLHGSWWHLLGNMLFLGIFGDNVEDYLGHFTYLLFYLTTGVASALFHTLLNLNSTTPTVGASGAIAGVMGAYFLLYPRARVLSLVPFYLVFFTWVPAWVWLGIWFVWEFLKGAAASLSPNQNAGGIAFWAHVGGFLSGMLLIKILPARPRRYYYGR